MRLGIIADLHANLPALQVVTASFVSEQVDQIIHLGDAIAIGPHPRECLEILLSFKGSDLIMGNHDHWYVHGLPEPRPDWMTDGGLQHQYWTHDQLGEGYKDQVADWLWSVKKEIHGFNLAFMHYALGNGGKSFKLIGRDLTADDLDKYFHTQADTIFFGHSHVASDLQGRARFLNPGSLGCQQSATAPYLLVEITNQEIQIHKRSITYDDRPLYKAFESREVPDREFIYKAFFGSRFP